MAIEIVFETHSWSEDNERGVATGWLPGRLSDRGRDLAHELGARRRDDWSAPHSPDYEPTKMGIWKEWEYVEEAQEFYSGV